LKTLRKSGSGGIEVGRFDGKGMWGAVEKAKVLRPCFLMIFNVLAIQGVFRNAGWCGF
jgi:hypothetical protein